MSSIVIELTYIFTAIILALLLISVLYLILSREREYEKVKIRTKFGEEMVLKVKKNMTPEEAQTFSELVELFIQQSDAKLSAPSLSAHSAVELG